MKRKFVKENKQLVKELLGGLISKIITGRAPKKLEKLLQKDPKYQKTQKEIDRLETQIKQRLEKARKEIPDFDKTLEKYGYTF